MDVGLVQRNFKGILVSLYVFYHIQIHFKNMYDLFKVAATNLCISKKIDVPAGMFPEK